MRYCTQRVTWCYVVITLRQRARVRPSRFAFLHSRSPKPIHRPAKQLRLFVCFFLLVPSVTVLRSRRVKKEKEQPMRDGPAGCLQACACSAPVSSAELFFFFFRLRTRAIIYLDIPVQLQCSIFSRSKNGPTGFGFPCCFPTFSVRYSGERLGCISRCIHSPFVSRCRLPFCRLCRLLLGALWLPFCQLWGQHARELEKSMRLFCRIRVSSVLRKTPVCSMHAAWNRRDIIVRACGGNRAFCAVCFRISTAVFP